jgi:hypothetical protein
MHKDWSQAKMTLHNLSSCLWYTLWMILKNYFLKYSFSCFMCKCAAFCVCHILEQDIDVTLHFVK